MHAPTIPCSQLRRRAGFTLLELSVVLVVIGLLVGSVLATQSYIRTTQLVTTVNQAKFYLNAMKQFERTYGGAVAGDMATATSNWSDVAGNGNGDGLIVFSGGNEAEYFYVFDHLLAAKLIEGNFTGLQAGSGVNDGKGGTNLPAMAVTNVAAYFYSPSNAGGYVTSNSSFFDGFYGTYLTVGGNNPGDNMPAVGFMTPQEAFELDAKFDNGIPRSGAIRTQPTAACVSDTSPASTTAIYNPTDTPNACNFYFIPG